MGVAVLSSAIADRPRTVALTRLCDPEGRLPNDELVLLVGKVIECDAKSCHGDLPLVFLPLMVELAGQIPPFV